MQIFYMKETQYVMKILCSYWESIEKVRQQDSNRVWKDIYVKKTPSSTRKRFPNHLTSSTMLIVTTVDNMLLHPLKKLGSPIYVPM